MAEAFSATTAALSASTARVTSNLTLCDNCLDIFRDKPGTTHEWELSYGELQASACECEFCRLQLNDPRHMWIAYGDGDSLIHNTAVVYETHMSEVFDLKIQSRCENSSSAGFYNLIEVPNAATSDAAYTASPMGSRLSKVPSSCGVSTGAEGALDTALSWARSCHGRHVKCKGTRLQSTSDLPTRLVDVGEPGNVHLRLVESGHLPPETNYMTLSHCWGGLKFATLTESSLENLKAHIDEEKLTLTFRHAIECTKRMNIRYLWIDSLCIIQDSPADWQREATRMGTYYQNSWCNIAASKARNGSEGCFSNRNTGEICPLRVKVEW